MNKISTKLAFGVIVLSVFQISVGQLFDGLVNDLLYLGFESSFNTTRDDCIWKSASDLSSCSLNTKILFSSRNINSIETVKVTNINDLKNVNYYPDNENIILVHGYVGDENDLPMNMLRDAYNNHGDYNVFLIDYGRLVIPPCYVAAVSNLHYAAKCIMKILQPNETDGLRPNNTICVGLSLGAHLCGLIAREFDTKIKKIIGLDPALPLITEEIKLRETDAHRVHAIHTNAGWMGGIGNYGQVDICINNGLYQPFCSHSKNPGTCSHISSACFLAQSLFVNHQQYAEACNHICPNLGLLNVKPNRIANQKRIIIGQNIDENVVGNYCFKDHRAPYCPHSWDGFGDERCCDFFKNITLI